MQWVRGALNPDGLANPTKIFPTPRTCGEGAKAGANVVANLAGSVTAGVELF
jgi:glycolate oxidase